MPATGTLFNEWRTADREAHKLERALTAASLAALEGRGEIPSEQQRRSARKLRETADDLFRLAMDEFATRARELDGRPPLGG